MSRVRAFILDDIPRVAELHELVAAGSSRLSMEDRQRYLREIFLDNPWYDDSLPSLVSEEQHGRIDGFLGVLPRPMSLDGRPIRAAISSQFVVRPGQHGLTVFRLAQTFLSGAQDLSMSDGANDVARKLWRGLGGTDSLLHGIHWTRPLRPTRYVASLASKRATLAPVAAVARPFCTLLDAIATRVRRSPFRLTAPAPAEELTVDALLDCFARHAPRAKLRGEYDRKSLEWLLEMAERKRSLGQLRKVLVRNSAGEVIGWYLYYVMRGGNGEVLQIGGRQETVGDVLEHLFHDAWSRGAIAVSGRLEPTFFDALTAKHCLLQSSAPWMLIHSRHHELVEAILCGDAFMTRLDGEWWMAFQN